MILSKACHVTAKVKEVGSKFKLKRYKKNCCESPIMEEGKKKWHNWSQYRFEEISPVVSPSIPNTLARNHHMGQFTLGVHLGGRRCHSIEVTNQ